MLFSGVSGLKSACLSKDHSASLERYHDQPIKQAIKKRPAVCRPFLLYGMFLFFARELINIF
ncbi:hypothetical protein BTA35_0212395 [Oceanospirillum linum]|uniref:Uncharacterized protein n=1 Tax=Oceanospirillum linum TaxID=966 RepID=A0A1T1H9Y9_OCELI|nr:hypothetical protein BTA35_0212395 [Oceanospirillum linum]